MPYEYGHGNWLEVMSLVVTIITLYFSLYFSFELTDAPLAVVTVLVIFTNVITLAIFLYELIRANWHVQLKNFGLSPKVRVNTTFCLPGYQFIDLKFTNLSQETVSL